MKRTKKSVKKANKTKKKTSKTISKTKSPRKSKAIKTKKPIREPGKTSNSRMTILVRLVKKTNDNDAFEELRICVASYIKMFGKKYRISGCDSDEIEQQCLYALRYKAIEDFNSKRGKFPSFAVLCMKRHLFSLIKGNSQQKRRVLNESLSLNEDRSNDGDNVSLASLIVEDRLDVDDQIAHDETNSQQKNFLLSKLSPLEQEVFKLYIQKYHYDEIVDELKRILPKRDVDIKAIDNAITRVKSKAQKLAKEIDWEE